MSSELPSSGELTAVFNYHLPERLIAQTPIEPRDASRLLCLDRASGDIQHRYLGDLPSLLQPGDLLVVNNSRVLPARLLGRKVGTGGRIELLLLDKSAGGGWRALVKPARSMSPGKVLEFPSHDGLTTATATVRELLDDGLAIVDLDPSMEGNLASFGQVPLPPYIHETLADPERYQTTYASVTGSAAAPTAGLHITPALRQRLLDAGIGWAEVTLHVGLDTFRPVNAERIADHRIHSEWCSVRSSTALQIEQTRLAGHRVIAVGTTSARVLETYGALPVAVRTEGWWGSTSIFITPGYKWTIVDGMLTNFHLPRSSLLMMVSALARREQILDAYSEAVALKYRFFSFGDAMLIL